MPKTRTHKFKCITALATTTLAVLACVPLKGPNHPTHRP